jgi:plasmid replication initiation protein
MNRHSVQMPILAPLASMGPNRLQATLQIFRALPGPFALRDARALMSYPFFSLSKSKRVHPIDYRLGELTIRVEGTHEHGLATIWDADVLMWAASQIVEARDTGSTPSRRISVTPHEILTFIGRGTSARDYLRLKSALDRLQSTRVATSLRQERRRRMHRFSWLNEWTEHADGQGRALGLELVLPDWWYGAIAHPSMVLTLDPGYFQLTGGIERWLYRLVRKHGGRQSAGWQFDLHHLHHKSGSLARYSDFALDLRRLVQRQSLPGYVVSIHRLGPRSERLLFHPLPWTAPLSARGATRVPVHKPVDRR